MTQTAYLTGKRTIDDRALDRRVLDQFSTALADRAAAQPDRPIEILEAGSGTGTMIARLAEWDCLPERVVYTGVDRDRECVSYAREHAPQWVEEAGYEIERTGTGFRARDGSQTIAVRYETGDVFDRSASVDAVIACAFCDLIALPDGLTGLFALLAPNGLLYAPITYDGRTRFVPADSFDETIETLYHDHMSTVRAEPGGPHAGRRLLEAAQASDGTVRAVGGSDWISRPVDGAYPATERVVIAELLATITSAVREVPDAPVDRIAEWERRREAELASGELTYIAHNLDLLVSCGQ